MTRTVSDAALLMNLLGIQLIGKRFDDAGVLKVARLVEKLRPPQRPWPE
jgi:aspartyl-tRNA(Asn)/glutamyl-tRNA(Gln) amidotransferase subunit A